MSEYSKIRTKMSAKHFGEAIGIWIMATKSWTYFKNIIVSKQENFDELQFPSQKRKMVEQHLSDNSTGILL